MLYNIIKSINSQMDNYIETRGLNALSKSDMQRELEDIIDTEVFNMEDALAFGVDEIDSLIEASEHHQVTDTDFVRTECYRRIPVLIEGCFE